MLGVSGEIDFAFVVVGVVGWPGELSRGEPLSEVVGAWIIVVGVLIGVVGGGYEPQKALECSQTGLRPLSTTQLEMLVLTVRVASAGLLDDIKASCLAQKLSNHSTVSFGVTVSDRGQ